MEVVSARLLSIVPLDVAPPPAAAAALGLGVLFVCGLGIVIIGALCVVVIRAIKKNNTPNDKG